MNAAVLNSFDAAFSGMDPVIGAAKARMDAALFLLEDIGPGGLGRTQSVAVYQVIIDLSAAIKEIGRLWECAHEFHRTSTGAKSSKGIEPAGAPSFEGVSSKQLARLWEVLITADDVLTSGMNLPSFMSDTGLMSPAAEHIDDVIEIIAARRDLVMAELERRPPPEDIWELKDWAETILKFEFRCNGAGQTDIGRAAEIRAANLKERTRTNAGGDNV